MYILILAILLLIFPTIIVLYDLIHNLNIWQKRVHIGKWNDINQWEAAISKRAKIWLAKSPVVSKKGNNRYILYDILKGDYSNNVIQSWQTAGLMIGLKEYSNKINEIEQIDVALMGYSILVNHPNPFMIKNQMDVIYHKILQIKGSNNTIPYRLEVNNIRFIDTIGLVCPFLVKYGLVYNNKSAIELAEKQIREYSSFINPQTKTPPHAYDLTHNVPLGVFDWGRGIGWYILGLVECFRIIDSGDFKDYLNTLIIEQSENLIKYQLKSGGFSASIFSTNSFAESSATVLCGLLFIEMFSITRDSKYKDVVEKIMTHLMRVTQRNGAIDICQGDTHGIGNYSTNFGYMPFVQGFALALIERYKHACS